MSETEYQIRVCVSHPEGGLQDFSITGGGDYQIILDALNHIPCGFSVDIYELNHIGGQGKPPQETIK